jgi:hypothetical protein
VYSCRDPEGHLWSFGTCDLEQARPFRLSKPSDAAWSGLRERISLPLVVVSIVIVACLAGMVATSRWMVVMPSEPGAGAKVRRLPARTGALPKRTEISSEEIGVLVVQGASKRLERPVQQEADVPRAASVASPAMAATGGDTSVEPSAQQSAEDALRQLRAAQRTAAEAFRRLRQTERAAAPAFAVTLSPSGHEPAAAKGDVARGTNGAGRSPGPAARKTRARPAAKAPVPPLPEQRSHPETWACEPSASSGLVVCHPPGKRSTDPAEKPPPDRPERRKEPAAQKAASEIWDCRARPPTGQVVCLPIAASPSQ